MSDLWTSLSAPIDVRLTVAGTPMPVAHGLGEIPTGMIVLLATGPIFTAKLELWDKSVAYVQTTASDVRARLAFVRLKENVTYVS